LPLDGAQEHLPHFVLALRGDEIAGCAGLERYAETGLLRSVAVREAERGMGLGQELTRRVLDAARESGVRQVILLTETARDFFTRFGFRQISRADVPVEALASVEFQTACPESATVMRVGLEG
jgi:amino-acid N-acetyltransferase